MADRKVGSGKKVSTLGVKDPVARKVLEELAARIAALELAMLAEGKG
jgi:hypothetical protein